MADSMYVAYANYAFSQPEDFSQDEPAFVGAKEPPTPLSTVYSRKRSVESWGYVDRMRAQEGSPYRSRPIQSSTTGAWTRRLTRCCTYLVASCSIVLPVAFLILGIIVICSAGKSLSSTWSIMKDCVTAAAAVWPVVLAAVVAQCLKTWIIFKAGRAHSRRNAFEGTEKPFLSSHRLELACLLVFLIWCLSPIGSQALGHVYGISSKTQEDQTNVWYVDKTGSNQMWSRNSKSAMSATNRSELVQSIGEKYISTLTSSNLELDPSNIDSLPMLILSAWNGSTSRSQDLAESDHGNSVGDANQDATVGTIPEGLKFSMTTSYFNMSCGDWNLTTRRFDNDSSPGLMSYSSSQTLGLSIQAGDNSTITSTGTVNFASLNKVGLVNGTRLNETSLVAHQKWEYSSITCQYQQLFYDVPINCSRTDGSGAAHCSQSGQASLRITSKGFAGTRLDDFAQDFVWTGNLPTTSRQATASESS